MLHVWISFCKTNYSGQGMTMRDQCMIQDQYLKCWKFEVWGALKIEVIWSRQKEIKWVALVTSWSHVSWFHVIWFHASWSHDKLIIWFHASWSHASWSRMSWSRVSWSRVSWCLRVDLSELISCELISWQVELVDLMKTWFSGNSSRNNWCHPTKSLTIAVPKLTKMSV